ncbi:MAG: hypothetical protein GX447_09495 [Elusimicrobia bacterium]|nr:hypothetical protein [Elusimicrobiota bacterium]
MKVFFSFVFISQLILSFSFASMKYNPVGELSVYGGKYYLDGDSSSADLKLDAFFSPSLILDEKNEIYPVYMGYYNGTQDVQELAGGGVLTRQRQEHTVSLKYLRINDFDKIKPRISYSKSLVKETKDEKWGKGLFDYDTLAMGVEFEQERPKGTFTQSYDYFSVRYPNYSSLISSAETAIDTTTYSELSKNAGENTMNNDSHRLAFSYTWFPEKSVMKVLANFTYRTYSDQSIVNEIGGFKTEKRKDMIAGGGFRWEKPSKNLPLSFDIYLDRQFSNQNSYDASRTKYIEDFYGYAQVSAGPRADFFFKNGSSFGYALNWRKIYYSGRLAQDAAGNYKNDKINQEFWLNSLYFRYPLGKKIFAKISYSYQTSSSNMRYEAGYRYNYSASSLLAGLQWEF